jgi:hypothetical protein
MKSIKYPLFAVLLALSAAAFAQTHEHKAADKVAPPSEAQLAFDKLKTVEGSWEGPVTTVPSEPSIANQIAQFSLRVTSRGNALVHELSVPGLPDHPVTMFYVNDDRLTLTHYCDAGNRPRMVGKVSPDGKTLEFDFLDLSGGNQKGHMHHALFTFIDENHHTEDWTYMMPGDKPMRAHFDLRRVKVTNARK